MSQMSFPWQKFISLASNSFSDIITILNNNNKKRKTGKREEITQITHINGIQMFSLNCKVNLPSDVGSVDLGS